MEEIENPTENMVKIKSNPFKGKNYLLILKQMKLIPTQERNNIKTKKENMEKKVKMVKKERIISMGTKGNTKIIMKKNIIKKWLKE